MRQFVRTTIAATLAAATVAAPAHALDTLRAGTPEPLAFVFSVVDVGIEAGIFKKYGLDVERIDFAGGAKLHQAMAAGGIDVAIGTGSDLLFLMKGAPERAVAAYGNDLNSLSLITRNDDTVKTIPDLKGKTIGTTTAGSFTTWIAKRIAGNHGVSSDQLKFAYLGSMNGIFAALMAKDVDAIVGTTAGGIVAQKQGRARIVVEAGAEITDFIADMLFASDTMMAQHPDELRRFLRAWFETIAFVKANKAETVRITEKDTRLSDDVASQIYDAEAPSFFTDGHFDRQKFAVVKQSLVDVGLVETTPPDDKLLTEEYLPSK
jgi:ABC-type nitrate/sulfonate/bicarbonate transport system substrate-binding protein